MSEPDKANKLFDIDLKAILQSSDKLTLVSLLVANMLPIFFAIVFGWDVGGAVIFYWVENLVIGFWSIWRIALASSGMMPVALHGGKVFMIPFFIVHYFGFCMGHGIFIAVLFSGVITSGSISNDNPLRHYQDQFSGFGSLESWSVLIAIVGIFASHGFSFFRNYVKNGQFRKSMPMQEMFRPYGRIVLLHVCIIFGGMLVAVLGSPIFLVVLLMLGKTLIDATVHLASHHGEASGSIWERLLSKKGA